MRVMGVDLGIAKVAVSIWEEVDGEWLLRETDVCNVEHVDNRPEQLMHLHDYIWDYQNQTRPDHVFIEDTLVGNNVKYSIQLSQTMGAVQVGLASRQLSEWFGIYTVNVSKWKATVIGSGRADKDRVRSWLKSYHSAYSVLCGDDQDRFDAAAIGFYGCLIADRAEVLA